MGDEVAGNLQALLHAAGKGGGQIVDTRGRDLYLLQPALRGGADVAVVTCAGGHQTFADIAACGDLTAQAIQRMLMHHAPFGAQQTATVGLVHAVQRTVLIQNLTALRRQP